MSRVGTEKKIEFLKENGLCVIKFYSASLVSMEAASDDSSFWLGLLLAEPSLLSSIVLSCAGYSACNKCEPIPLLGGEDDMPPCAPSEEMEKDNLLGIFNDSSLSSSMT